MGYDLAVTLNWAGNITGKSAFEDAEAADEAGVHSIWSGEAWGGDGFTPLVLLAARTRQIRLGMGIANIYSRSPAALAQHFASLDDISGGRAIIGLGTSGANVVEHFHGVPFRKPLTRMREYIDILNLLLAQKPLIYNGEIFQLERGFTLRMELARPHIPIFVASLTPKSVRQTAELADGWLPIWTPVADLPAQVRQFRDYAKAAGRDPAALSVRAPGTIVVTPHVDQAREALAGMLAFYIARMGVFYYEHVSRLGYQEMADAVRAGWEAGGSKGGAAAVPPETQQAMGLVTSSVEEARERLAEQAAAGIDLHSVQVHADSPQALRQTYEALAK